ncbi:MAG: C-terminal target protein [Flavipsychrobacter sp.]|nr:C-terminal target protein [Flavipsychrobacter sp.]
MKKNIYLLLFAIISCTGKSIGQTVSPCATSEMRLKYIQQNPEILKYEERLEQDIKNYVSNHGESRLARKTAEHSDTDWYDIPVVVHVVHDYGAELLSDNKIYNLISEMNTFYAMENNLSAVIAPFKKYIGRAKFRFHLATKDPNGQPTKGITHRYSYLTYGGDDNAKQDQWNPANYINIWFENVVGQKIKDGIIVAYATQPATANVMPFRDGIISNYSFIDDGSRSPSTSTGGSIDHEMGHVLNLDHTFGKTNNPHTNKPGSCSDDDGVDDTPPTEGNLGGCHLYDTVCASNNFKIYVSYFGGDSLVNFPDTSNEQNIMNYADCKYMFTQGQVTRMRAALNSDVGKRDSLWSPNNLEITGALAGTSDLRPITDFVIRNATNNANIRFTCPGTKVNFVSACWGDTIQTVNWTFPADASTPTATNTQAANIVTNVASSINNTLNTPGWNKVTLAATGNNSGTTTTTTYDNAIFVADATGVNADGYFMEFTSPDTAKWPLFNYYGNDFKWKYADVGYYDNKSIMYTGFESRSYPASATGSPYGDYDDIFSVPMDLSSFTGACNLNYYYSATSRTSNFYDINDALEIDYSIDHALTWKRLDTISKGRLINNGTIANAPYVPTVMSDWSPMSISVPTAARTSYTVFRFRYHPGVSTDKETGTQNISSGGGSYSTGNNFYMDRIYFSQWPAAVDNTQMNAMDVKVVPNPTSGDAYVMIKDAGNTTATIVVSDITGKQVYTVSQQISGSSANIQIPREAISVKGIYMVQTVTGNQTRTQKLVVY